MSLKRIFITLIIVSNIFSFIVLAKEKKPSIKDIEAIVKEANNLMKNGELVDIAKASDLSNIESLDKTVKKHILCYIRDI